MSQMEILSNQYNELLNNYKQTYKNYILSLNKFYALKNKNMIHESSHIKSLNTPDYLQYSYELKTMNQKLLDLNQIMINTINTSTTNFNEDIIKVNKQKELLNKNNDILHNEKYKIDKLISQHESLDNIYIDSEIKTNEYYYRYISLLFILILLILHRPKRKMRQKP